MSNVLYNNNTGLLGWPPLMHPNLKKVAGEKMLPPTLTALASHSLRDWCTYYSNSIERNWTGLKGVLWVIFVFFPPLHGDDGCHILALQCVDMGQPRAGAQWVESEENTAYDKPNDKTNTKYAVNFFLIITILSIF